MPSKVTELIIDKEVVYIQLMTHFKEPINFRVNFETREIQYKDGYSIKGYWKSVNRDKDINILKEPVWI